MRRVHPLRCPRWRSQAYIQPEARSSQSRRKLSRPRATNLARLDTLRPCTKPASVVRPRFVESDLGAAESNTRGRACDQATLRSPVELRPPQALNNHNASKPRSANTSELMRALALHGGGTSPIGDVTRDALCSEVGAYRVGDGRPRRVRLLRSASSEHARGLACDALGACVVAHVRTACDASSDCEHSLGERCIAAPARSRKSAPSRYYCDSCCSRRRRTALREAQGASGSAGLEILAVEREF